MALVPGHAANGRGSTSPKGERVCASFFDAGDGESRILIWSRANGARGSDQPFEAAGGVERPGLQT